MARVIGYGLCGAGESERYLVHTLKEFDRLCDETVILLNNAGKGEKSLIESFGFHTVEDNREWGRNQNKIKEDFVRNHVAQLEPDITIPLDMDEVFVNVTREKIESVFEDNQAFYVYIVNMWDSGYRSDWSFWNVRMWGWKYRELLGDKAFFKFEPRPLHCGLAPKWAYALNVHAPFVLEHYGLKKKEDREAKVKRYEKYDPRQIYRFKGYYNALKSNHCEPYNKKNVVKLVEEHIESIKQPLNKKPIMNKNHGEKVLIVREADGFVFEVEEKFVGQQLKQKYKGKGFRVFKKKEKPRKNVKPENKCDECDFIAKTKAGLKSHQRKHS